MSSKRRSISSVLRVEALEGRQLMAAPVIGAIEGLSGQTGDISVPLLKTRLVPLTATDADGDAVDYEVSSDRRDVSATILTGASYLKLSVSRQETSGDNPTFTALGDMVFQLLPEFAPQTVTKISELVVGDPEEGVDPFYNGLTFHRIVPNFVIQGGDPAGNGSGGPNFRFDDEFDARAIFSGDGQLAMANSGKDTNGSQFFITTGSQRFLDFNHSIFGQLVRGFDVLRDVNDEPNSGSPSNSPLKPIIITSASFVENQTDAVLLLKSNSGGFANITVTARNGVNGEASSTTFEAVVAADTTDDPPILGPVANLVTPINTPTTIILSATDLENDPVTYVVENVANPGGPTPPTISVTGNKATITPAPGAIGTFQLRAKVKQTDMSIRGSSNDPFDIQTFTLTVSEQVIAPQINNLDGKAGVPVAPVILTFTTTVALSADSYTANIDWGDGSKSVGTVRAAADGGGKKFEVLDTRTYFRAGQYDVKLTILEKPTGITISPVIKASIADALLTSAFASPAVVPGTGTVTGRVATFTSTNAGARFSDLSAVIEWGDGTSSPGTILGSSGSYTVDGTHTYANLGEFAIKVKVLNAGGSSTEASGSITIVNRAPVFTEIQTPTVSAGTSFTVPVRAIDPDPGQALTYSLAPGTPSGATLDPVTGLFSWTAPMAPGLVPITVVATDSGGPSMATTLTFNVDVRSAVPVVQVQSRLLTGRKGKGSSIRLEFDGDIDPSSVGLFTDIALVKAGRDRTLGTADDVTSRVRGFTYDSKTRTMVLRLSQPLGANAKYRVRLSGVSDTIGRAVDVDGDGLPGGTFVRISGKKLGASQQSRKRS